MKDSTEQCYYLNYMNKEGLEVCSRVEGGPLYSTCVMRNKAQELLNNMDKGNLYNFIEKSKSIFKKTTGKDATDDYVECMYVDPTEGQMTSLLYKSRKTNSTGFIYPNPLYMNTDSFKQLTKQRGVLSSTFKYVINPEKLSSIITNYQNKPHENINDMEKDELIKLVLLKHNICLDDTELYYIQKYIKKEWLEEIMFQYNCRNIQ